MQLSALIVAILLFHSVHFIDAVQPNVTALDCSFRKLVSVPQTTYIPLLIATYHTPKALSKAKAMQPFRTASDFAQIAAALELGRLCGVKSDDTLHVHGPQVKTLSCELARYHVDSVRGDDNAVGNRYQPFQSLQRAIAATRSHSPSSCRKTIVLHPGVHFLANAMALGPKDSRTSFVAAPGSASDSVWLSGGRALLANETTWSKVANKKYFVTKLPAAFGSEVSGLFTLKPVSFSNTGGGSGKQHARLTRARYPNADPETDTWGYASLDRAKVCINASAVIEWWVGLISV